MTKGITKDKVAMIIDNGVFTDFAIKISEDFKHTYYYTEWKESYPHMNKVAIGSEWVNGKQLDTFDGKNFQSVENMFDYIDQCDIVIFLDVYNGDLQEFLVSKGVRVFGPRKGEELELERFETKQY